MAPGRLIAPILLLLSLSAPLIAAEAFGCKPADSWSLHLSIQATVSGRKYFFFTFKGMLLAEAEMRLSMKAGPDQSRIFSFHELQRRTYLLMTANRKATEMIVEIIGETPHEGQASGREVISEWEQAYPEWARNIHPEKRKSLPFVVAPSADAFSFKYDNGIVSDSACGLSPIYPWPSKDPMKLTIFDGLRAALSLYNHSPFGNATMGSTASQTFPIATALREICITILPQVRSEVEFTEASPLSLSYQYNRENHSAVLQCLGQAHPSTQVGKSFILDTYRREALLCLPGRQLLRDRISVFLTGTKGNSITIVIDLQNDSLQNIPL